jgi:oligogalacturonide transport system permease protein
MSLDVTDTISWNQTMAMSVLSMLPPVLLFFMAQKYFVEGISTTGLKG